LIPYPNRDAELVRGADRLVRHGLGTIFMPASAKLAELLLASASVVTTP
jgi:hypothetical protein